MVPASFTAVAADNGRINSSGFKCLHFIKSSSRLHGVDLSVNTLYRCAQWRALIRRSSDSSPVSALPYHRVSSFHSDCESSLYHHGYGSSPGFVLWKEKHARRPLGFKKKCTGKTNFKNRIRSEKKQTANTGIASSLNLNLVSPPWPKQGNMPVTQKQRNSAGA